MEDMKIFQQNLTLFRFYVYIDSPDKITLIEGLHRNRYTFTFLHIIYT